MEEELKDRYGPIPEPLANLLRIIDLKILLTGLRMKRLEYAENQVILHVTDADAARHEEGAQACKRGQGADQTAARWKDRDKRRSGDGRHRRCNEKYIDASCRGMI